MNVEDEVTWLIGEVRDLLDASSVGLYEFIWLIRGRHLDADHDSREIAKSALSLLLSEGAGRLVLLKWPGEDSEGDMDPESLCDADWDDPHEHYVALARN
jgi:hypothetical protein